VRAGGRVVALVIGLAAALPAAAQDRAGADLPVIVDVAVSPRVRSGEPAALRLAYRAPLANVVAVVEAIEDLDGPTLTRATRQREIGVVARAYGYEAGELVVPLAFATPGWKRVTLTLVTDQREQSDAAVVEVEVLP
jgi:hypothetical protein